MNQEPNKGMSADSQPNEIEVGNLVIKKLSRDEYWDNPRNRKTRICVEILMRECYLTGWNNQIEYASTKLAERDKRIKELEAKISELENKPYKVRKETL